MSESKETTKVDAEMLRTLLDDANTEIKNLKLQLEYLNRREIEYRDKVALYTFISFITNGSLQLSYTDMAVEAYKATTAFIKVQDQGEVYESEIIEDLKDLVKNHPNNQALGEIIRKLYNPNEK